jgi:hypothetical protein
MEEDIPCIRPFARTSIHLDPELSKLMPVDPQILDIVVERMKKYGFDQHQPITLWDREDGEKVLIDGRTKFEGSIKAGIPMVYVVIIRIPGGAEEARERVLSAQRDRRQKHAAIILYRLARTELVQWGGKRNQVGKTSADVLPADLHAPTTLDRLAKELGVSVSSITRVRDTYYTPLPEEKKQSLRDGKLSPYELVPRGDDSIGKLSVQKKKAGTQTEKDLAHLKRLGIALEQGMIVIRKAKTISKTVNEYLRDLVLLDISEGDISTRQEMSPTEKPLAKEMPQPMVELPLPQEEFVGALREAAAREANDSLPPVLVTGSEAQTATAKLLKDNRSWQDCQTELLYLTHLTHPGKAFSEIADEYCVLEHTLLGKTNRRIHTIKAAERKFEELRKSRPKFLMSYQGMNDLELEAVTRECKEKLRNLEAQP